MRLRAFDASAMRRLQRDISRSALARTKDVPEECLVVSRSVRRFHRAEHVAQRGVWSQLNIHQLTIFSRKLNSARSNFLSGWAIYTSLRAAGNIFRCLRRGSSEARDCHLLSTNSTRSSKRRFHKWTLMNVKLTERKFFNDPSRPVAV